MDTLTAEKSNLTIEPYFEHSGVTIYHGDMLNVLPLIYPDSTRDDQLPDLIIADPPYAQTSLQWDVWPHGWPDAAANVLKDTGSMWCFGSLKMFMQRSTAFGLWRFAQDIVWEKHNGSSFHADRFKRVHEQAAQFYRVGSQWEGVYKAPVTTPDATARTVRTKRRPNHMGKIDKTPYVSEDGGPRLMRSVIYARSCHGFAVNETQKPIALTAPLIESSCPPGGLILEPFGGSAPAAFYALNSGRRAVVCETRESQCEAAALRLILGSDREELPEFRGAR